MDKNINVYKRISRFNLDCSVKANNYKEKERKFYHGHEYVDLGLPSGTLWAVCNVGTESETTYDCDYYMYGNGSKTYNSSDEIYRGTEPLDPNADTATQVLGGKWHTPTREQMEELTINTTYDWVTNYKDSGINGGLFTSKINGNSVFFPVCGYYVNGNRSKVGSVGCYWSSSPNGNNGAYYLTFYSRGYWVYSSARYCGYAVRPVLNLD